MPGKKQGTWSGQNKNESRQIVGTDPRLIEAIEYRWGSLEMDLATVPELAKAPLFITPEQDSLNYNTEWPLDILNYVNPPFNNIEPFARKAAGYRRAYGDRFRLLFLLPASIGTRYYAEQCYPYASTIPLIGRPMFQGYESKAGNDHMILDYAGEAGTMQEPWDWEAAWARS